MINRFRLAGAVPRLVPLRVVDGWWRPFGHGAHYCVGAALARAEAAQVLRRLTTAERKLVASERAASSRCRRAVCGAEQAGCMIPHGAGIDWDQPGRFPYDRTHAEL